MHHSFCKAVSEGKEIRIVFLDISKAFHRVWHKGLLFKLKKWGICGSLLNWFKSYLSERYQRVIVNGQKSKFNQIFAGVPQGSVLGPLLFLVFINDITHVVRHCQIRLFADDTCLFITVDDKLEAANLINKDLSAIDKWSKKWLVSFSPPKTETMLISTKRNPIAHPTLFLQDKEITEVQIHKHVGLNLESNLWWNYHINEIETKALSRLNIMKIHKFKLNRETLEKIYLVFVRPILEYADVVWAGAHNKDLLKLDKVQVEALRIVTGCTKRSNVANLYKECNWETLSERRDKHVLKMMYRINHKLTPSYLFDILPSKFGEIANYNLRHAQNFNLPATRTESFKQSFIPRGVKMWNSLELSIRNSTSLSSFNYALSKNQSKQILRNKSKLYAFGNRFNNIIYSRLGVGCSSLNFDLCFNLKVLSHSRCLCGDPYENSHHFFLKCPLYNDLRTELFANIIMFSPINLNTILFGNSDLSLPINKQIFLHVHKYINDSKRFSD